MTTLELSAALHFFLGGMFVGIVAGFIAGFVLCVAVSSLGSKP